MGSIAMMAAWLPTFYHDMQGVPIRRFAVFAMVGFVGGLCGTLTAGWMMDRLGARRLIPAIYLCLALAVCALGFVRFGTPLFLALIIGWNFCQSGGQALLNTLLTRIYPARMRSTGMGWAGGIGRTGGGLVAPLFGGLARTGFALFAVNDHGLCRAAAVGRGSGDLRDVDDTEEFVAYASQTAHMALVLTCLGFPSEAYRAKAGSFPVCCPASLQRNFPAVAR
jgi:MFS family permease